MPVVEQSKKETCKYDQIQRFVEEQKRFGLIFNSKLLLNRFGNPLSPNEDVDEDDLREKCYYEVTFIRHIDKEKLDKINSIEHEYSSLKPKSAYFSRGRATACVFLTIGMMLFLALGFSLFEGLLKEEPDYTCVIFFILSFAAFIGLFLVIFFGVFDVIEENKKNEKIWKRKKELAEQAAELLKEENK